MSGEGVQPARLHPRMVAAAAQVAACSPPLPSPCDAYQTSTEWFVLAKMGGMLSARYTAKVGKGRWGCSRCGGHEMQLGASGLSPLLCAYQLGKLHSQPCTAVQGPLRACCKAQFKKAAPELNELRPQTFAPQLPGNLECPLTGDQQVNDKGAHSRQPDVFQKVIRDAARAIPAGPYAQAPKSVSSGSAMHGRGSTGLGSTLGWRPRAARHGPMPAHGRCHCAARPHMLAPKKPVSQ